MKSFLPGWWRSIHRCCLSVAWTIVAASTSPATAQSAIDGYADYESFAAKVKALDESDLVTAESLGKTLGGREVFLLTLSTGKPAEKPAILILGNVFAPHLVGSELALRMAQQMAAAAAKDDAARRLLDRYTFYFIPRPTPDASEAFFRKPYVERAGNERSTDDDRDGEFNEDPVDDLNGDGWITMLRVEDPAGKLMPHPADPRVLIDADPRKDEHGQYTLYTEGRDNDGDERLNEDGPGGVSFNRNFPFRYPYFQAEAGPHQVSEIETRAVADFAFGHPNIAVVFTFTPEDNLMDPWKPNPGAEGERIKTTLLAADAEYFNFLADQYRTIHGGKDAPASPKGEGSFSDWAYFQYGRWSLAARGWWIPKSAAKPDPQPSPADGAAKEPEKKPDDKPKPEEKRGADDVNALTWLKNEGIDGFVDWKPIEHPDFPGKKVEVGGFKPFLRLNPPAKELDPLAEKHVKFITRLTELLPSVKIADTKVESLGADVFRVTATAINNGFLPTLPAMGRVSEEPNVLQIKIELAEGMKLVTGHPRFHLEVLPGNGGKLERTWLISTTGAKNAEVKLMLWSAAVGSDSKTLELK